MSILRTSWEYLKGGWKTYGPNSIIGPGAFDSSDGTFESVSAEKALRIGAFMACANLRAETIGSLPMHLRDKDKNPVVDHDLYNVLHTSPNAMQTASEFWSMAVANIDIYGNSISIVKRRTRDRSVISLEPVDPLCVKLLHDKTRGHYYEIDGEKFDPEDILHLKGFTHTGHWGLPRLELGRNILHAQVTANEFAMRSFKQGTKIGGFMAIEKDGQNLTEPQVIELAKRLDHYSKPENAGKFMTLFKGVRPISGAEFRVKPVDAELLTSRYFGIEEICRLMQTPPQLIGHSDKASSWASSLEQVNLFFLMYSLQPTFIRIEKRSDKTLLSNQDRRLGLSSKFNIAGLLRSDMKTQSAMFASALQNGYYNRDEVRDMLDRGKIPDGEKYTIQMNMTGINGDQADDNEKKEPKA